MRVAPCRDTVVFLSKNPLLIGVSPSADLPTASIFPISRAQTRLHAMAASSERELPRFRPSASVRSDASRVAPGASGGGLGDIGGEEVCLLRYASSLANTVFLFARIFAASFPSAGSFSYIPRAGTLASRETSSRQECVLCAGRERDVASGSVSDFGAIEIHRLSPVRTRRPARNRDCASLPMRRILRALLSVSPRGACRATPRLRAIHRCSVAGAAPPGLARASRLRAAFSGRRRHIWLVSSICAALLRTLL